MYLFYPTQFREFGRSFYEDPEKGFSFRYQEGKRFFGLQKTIYIPYGPICKDFSAFEAFLDFLETKKRTKVYIDLPLILDPNIQKKVSNALTKSGYKEKPSKISDNETILVEKEKYQPNDRSMRYIKRGFREFDIKVEDKLSEDKINLMHNLYLSNVGGIESFNPKPVEAFERICQNGVTAVAYAKDGDAIEGFLIGYIDKLPSDFSEGKEKEVLFLMFTALSDRGRDEKVGFALHSAIFDEAFTNRGVEIADFLGADRKMDRSYTEFKMKWGGEFVPFGGSYQKTIR